MSSRLETQLTFDGDWVYFVVHSEDALSRTA
jgi:hypothetical protein